jgi:protein-L-isoaspartate(D-aspartate) O-methyltransferase
MPWLVVNHTRLLEVKAVPTPLFALDVQRGSIPGHPGAKRTVSLTLFNLLLHVTRLQMTLYFAAILIAFRLSRQLALSFCYPAKVSSQMQSDKLAALRELMVSTQLRVRGISDERVLAAMARVPRHEFVAEEYHGQAYEDHPLPIGEGQTVSQPYIVAIMLEAPLLTGAEKVLEIGTGSGYVTALLAELTREVYSVERHASLARAAESVLHRLGYKNVYVLAGDGTKGLAEQAPFDAIIVSAAAPRIPPALFEQLAEGGRMILPVGPAHAQQLQLVHKRNGVAQVTNLEGCRFVPLVGSEGYSGT